MKIVLVILAILFVAPIFAQTYTETEFVVEGETRTTPVTPQPGITTTVVTTSTEAPIYVGMGKYHVIEVIGQPTYVEKFRRFAGRQQGIYDEVWTYQTPTGNTYVYIKERRVLKIEYR